jgi:hypothetical protein
MRQVLARSHNHHSQAKTLKDLGLLKMATVSKGREALGQGQESKKTKRRKEKKKEKQTCCLALKVSALKDATESHVT